MPAAATRRNSRRPAKDPRKVDPDILYHGRPAGEKSWMVSSAMAANSPVRTGTEEETGHSPAFQASTPPNMENSENGPIFEEKSSFQYLRAEYLS